MRKIVVCLLAMAALFVFQSHKVFAQNNLENVQAVVEEEMAKIEAGVYGKTDIEEVKFRFDGVRSDLSRIVEEKLVVSQPVKLALKVIMVRNNQAINSQSVLPVEYCNFLNNYNWAFEAAYAIVIGKLIPYQTCGWHLTKFVWQTLIFCPGACQCNPNIWCIYQQYARLKSLIEFLNCQG
jgi:hypothetical protein